MKRYIFYFLLSCLFFSCEEEDAISKAGYLELGVTKNVEVIAKSVDPSTQPLAVAICQTVSGKEDTVKYYSDFEDMVGEKIALPVGNYSVKVATNRSEKSGFDKPSFAGVSDKVVIKQGETTKTSIECFLTNVKVTTEFTRPVKENFKSCVASIGNTESGFLLFGTDEGRAAYFLPGYLLVNLTIENKEGVTFKMSKLIENTKPREHYNFIFDLIPSGGSNSGLDFDIKIDTDPTNDEEHTVTIPLPETGYGQDAPVIKLEGVNSENTIILKENDTNKEKYNVTIKAISENIGIKKVLLMVNTNSSQFKDIPTLLDLTELQSNSKEMLLFSDLGFIFTTDYSNLKTEKQYIFTPQNLYAGDYTFTLSIQDFNGQISTASISYAVKSEISTEDINNKPEYVWSTFAILRGYTANKSVDDCLFKIRKIGDDSWSLISDGLSASADGYISVKVNGLTKSTEYEYCFVRGDSEGLVKSFVTDAEEEIPNLDFESWSNQYTPNGWWDSGNTGTGETLGHYSTIREGTDKNYSVKMYSAYVEKTVVFVPVKKFVAGNIFIGTYAGTDIGSQAAKLNFGHKYTSRPSKLEFDYKYVSKIVNRGNHNGLSGKSDFCHIYIALATKEYNINTGDETTFINFESDESIIAYGEFSSNETISDFARQSIKLKYKQLDKKPSYIIITGTSSKYGDYFTGGEGSTLWLDNLKLLYDDIESVEK